MNNTSVNYVIKLDMYRSKKKMFSVLCPVHVFVFSIVCVNYLYLSGFQPHRKLRIITLNLHCEFNISSKYLLSVTAHLVYEHVTLSHLVYEHVVPHKFLMFSFR